MEHGQLLPQPIFALAQRADPSPDCGDMLPDGEVEPVAQFLAVCSDPKTQS